MRLQTIRLHNEREHIADPLGHSSDETRPMAGH
jgi:hypothetical protein